ncbi:hypothetical protein KBI5_13415 [Frankia sp. KB5]|nr:hypothetical protein KBI5_13415 [Frankia sp. KB5]
MISDGESRLPDSMRSDLSVVLMAHPAEPPAVEMPPVIPGFQVRRPVLVFPGGMRVCVDAMSTDREAATWWADLAVQATYASIWHGNRSEDEREITKSE